MATWSPMDHTETTELLDVQDGDWYKLAVWLGDPPQLLSALVSTSGTSMLVPIDESCSGRASFNESIQLPYFGRDGRRLTDIRHSWGEVFEHGQYARLRYLPQASRTWNASSGCSRGSDILIEALWTRVENMNDVFKGMEPVRVPVEQTYGIPSIGMRAVATEWRGNQDYWWPVMTAPIVSLFQSVWIPAYAANTWQPPNVRFHSLRYTYEAGAVYAWRIATLRVGSVEFFPRDSYARSVTRPLSEDGALKLEFLTLNITTLNNSISHSPAVIPLISDPLLAELDSTSPFLELPRQVCFDIAWELNLQYERESGLFLMSDAVIQRLRDIEQPSLQFGLGLQPDSVSGDLKTGRRLGLLGPCNVSLPFGALIHMHTPANSEPSRRSKPFFPIRIADEARGIVLGRTFFQEIALQVDYNANEFSVVPHAGWYITSDTTTHVNPPMWPQWIAVWLPQIMLGFVVLSGLLLLPSLKFVFNMQERHNRQRNLERSWVHSHTLEVDPAELDYYANAAVGRVGQDANASLGPFSQPRLTLRSARDQGRTVMAWLLNSRREGEIRLG